VVKRKTIRAAVLEQMRRLRLRENAVELPVSALSGGNQQKAALARWLLRDSRLLILDEPTRGVDIGAKREIYELIDKLARAGKPFWRSPPIYRRPSALATACWSCAAGESFISYPRFQPRKKK
jgi:ABC-type Na+ transport system ATPase subunit NatA